MFFKILKTVTGILLLPLAVGVWRAFYLQISGIAFNSGTLLLIERGVLFYLLFHVFIIQPIYLYVLGHEVVHVLATWMTGGRVVSFKIASSGGNVVTSKTNFFIELSPYFVPFYTIMLGIIFCVLDTMQTDIVYMPSIFVFLVGATMAFHFVMTSEAIRAQQSDIIRSGVIFSFVTIFIGNLMVVIAVFTPLFDGISFIQFIKGSWASSCEIYKMLYARGAELVNNIKAA